VDWAKIEAWIDNPNTKPIGYFATSAIEPIHRITTDHHKSPRVQGRLVWKRNLLGHRLKNHILETVLGGMVVAGKQPSRSGNPRTGLHQILDRFRFRQHHKPLEQ